MPTTGLRQPRMRIIALRNQGLAERRCWPWVFHAPTNLQLAAASTSARFSQSLPFRLDTETFVSAIPELWLAGRQKLKPFLPALAAERIRFQTAAGEGIGRMAQGVRVRFADAPGQVYTFDLLVTSGLNARDYGLLSLRDLVRNFDIRTEGKLHLSPFGDPVHLPELVLTPWSASANVVYRCPQCRAEALGKAGLNLACYDCNRPLVRQGAVPPS